MFASSISSHLHTHACMYACMHAHTHTDTHTLHGPAVSRQLWHNPDSLSCLCRQMCFVRSHFPQKSRFSLSGSFDPHGTEVGALCQQSYVSARGPSGLPQCHSGLSVINEVAKSPCGAVSCITQYISSNTIKTTTCPFTHANNTAKSGITGCLTVWVPPTKNFGLLSFRSVKKVAEWF